MTSLAAAQVGIQPSGDVSASSPIGAVTPQIGFVNASNSPVGATNATGNNLAGARNSTIGNMPVLSSASTMVPVYTQPPLGLEAYPPEAAQEGLEAARRDVGSTRSFSAYGNGPDLLPALAKAAERARPRRPGARIYTNSDLEKLAASFGSVALSTVRDTAATEASAVAAQAALDRNLGARGTAEPPVQSAPR